MADSPFQQPYGQGTVSIGKLTIDNPMRLEKTAAPKSAPAPAPAPTQQKTTGGDNTAPSNNTYVDPYAAWGGTAAYNALVADFNNQKAGIQSTSNDAATISARERYGSILDYLNSTQNSQNALNERGVQNELARKQGLNSITDMIGTGLRSGGTMLANKNALNSSAAEAIARAYSKLGQREAGKVGTQYEGENRKIGIDQQTLDSGRALQMTKFGLSKQNSIDSIVSNARNSLAALDAQMAGKSMPQRIAIEQEKNSIMNAVNGIISQYDAQLQSGNDAIKASSVDQRRLTAQDLATKGTAATNPFDFSTDVPVEYQNTGPFNSDLPIFSYRGKKAAA